jgi:hypothetical protein
MVLKKGLSRMRGDLHVRFLGGGGTAMCRCYPTRTARPGDARKTRARMRADKKIAPCGATLISVLFCMDQKIKRNLRNLLILLVGAIGLEPLLQGISV